MFQFVNLSIRNKILFIALIGGLGLSINIYYTHTVVNENSSRLNKINNDFFPVIEKTDASIAFLDKINHLFTESITSGETIFIESTEVPKNKMYESLKGMGTISPEKKDSTLKLIDEFDLYYTSYKELAEGIISGKLHSIALRNAVEKKNTSFENFQRSLINFRDANLRNFSYLIEKTDMAAQKSLDMGIIIFIIVVWLLMFSTLAVISTISSSFDGVITSLKNMAAGKIGADLPDNFLEDDKNHVPEELVKIKDALDSVTKRFIETEKEILNLNISLQDKVDDATSQLLDANKKLEEAVISANNANQAKSTFLANMSHELRTPMNAIIGYGELLEEDINNKEYQNVASDIESIRTASKHLLSLISDVLDLSKIEAGRMDFNPVPFNLAQLIYDIESTIKPLVIKGNNAYSVDIQTDSNEMFSDVIKLKQILLNLLSNACKFTKEGEIKLAISSHYQNHVEYLHFEVSDTGIGVPANKIESLFESFTQADATTTRRFGGTGLGLAISRRYAQMMGGDIRAKSKENIGSSFMLITPLQIISRKIA